MTDIGIVVNSLDSPIVTNPQRRPCALGVEIEYIVQDEQLGLAHATALCREFVGGEPFTVFLGDNIFQDKMTDLLTSFADSDKEAAVVLGAVNDPTRFGIAEIDNGRILRVVEKPVRSSFQYGNCRRLPLSRVDI